MPIAPLPGAKPNTDYRYPSAEDSPYTTAVARHDIKAQDPAFMPHLATRTAVTDTGGAEYGITVAISNRVAPEAGATQANGRILKPSIMRSAPNFSEGMLDHN